MSSNNTDGKLIKVKAYYSFCLFPRPPVILGKGGNTFGITKFEVIEVLEGEPKMGFDAVITVTGEFTSPPQTGKPYIILAKEIEHPQYGTQYSLLYLNQQMDLKKLNNQKSFLKSFLTEGQIKAFYDAYEDPLAVIEAHDVEGLKKVKGVGDYIANCIINRFEDNKDMSNIYVELDSYGLTPNFIQKLIKRYKSSSEVISVVKNYPYRLAYEMDGVGFKTADDISLKGGLDPKSPERIAAYIKNYLEEELQDGNSYVTAGELLANLYNYFGGKDYIQEYILDENGDIVSTNIGEGIDILASSNTITIEENENKSRRRIYLTRTYELEEAISDNLKRLLKAQNRFNYFDWEEKIKDLEERQGFNFADEQLEGIKLGLDKQVCLISGLAGAGKSSLVSGILESLKSYSFAQCALSGKAAARLQEVTGELGTTIHRLLGYQKDGFFYNKENKLPYDIIVLDEVSLVGGDIFLKLVEAIPDGAKLIMLGDMGQLESIGALNLAADIHDSPIIPTVELTQVHRQAARSGIITSAHSVRNQEQLYGNLYEGVDIRGELQDMIFDIAVDREKNRSKVLAWFKKYYESDIVEKDIMKIQLIAPVKERGDCCVFNLNLDVQNVINPIVEDKDKIKMGTKEKPYYIQIGDKVMCIKNNYETKDESGGLCPIYNGWVGIVKFITQEHVVVDFPLAGGWVYIPIKDAHSELVLGYVSTVHKLQGSDAPVVIGVIDYATPPKMLTCQLLYTLITRAKKRCVIIGESGALVKAISSNYVSTKRTFLKELLDKE